MALLKQEKQLRQDELSIQESEFVMEQHHQKQIQLLREERLYLEMPLILDEELSLGTKSLESSIRLGWLWETVLVKESAVLLLGLSMQLFH
jgi:hypothetical protein